MTRIFFPLVMMSLAISAAPQPEKEFRFEVFSIRPVVPLPGAVLGGAPSPNGYTTKVTLWQAIAIAYVPGGLDPRTWASVKIHNDPGWFADYYQIDALVAQADLKAWQNQSKDKELLRSALRAALKERCKLVIHEQPSQEPIFELVVAKGGPKLKAAAPDATLPVGVKLASGGVMAGIGPRGEEGWDYHAATMPDLALFLSGVSVVTPVRDRTGLTGRYDFTLPHVQLPSDEARVYSYSLDRLGLKLRPGTENRPILVIDHVEKPTPN